MRLAGARLATAFAAAAANAAFAAVTGSSIAAAAVFTRVSVPEMIRYDYSKRFAIGVWWRGARCSA
jgi:TRAP-type C4-dicarboxylate transport system permease large subunit